MQPRTRRATTRSPSACSMSWPSGRSPRVSRMGRSGGAGDFVGSTMLDWKGGYADGYLGRWTRIDLAEFLLEWFPRKVSVQEEMLGDVVDCAIAFLRFLDDRDSLSGEPLDVLEEACDRMLAGGRSGAQPPDTKRGKQTTQRKSQRAARKRNRRQLERLDQLRAGTTGRPSVAQESRARDGRRRSRRSVRPRAAPRRRGPAPRGRSRSRLRGPRPACAARAGQGRTRSSRPHPAARRRTRFRAGRACPEDT